MGRRENLVRFATVVVDYQHTPGRSHAGAVLGAKKLKAVVVRGTKPLAVKSPQDLENATRDFNERMLNYPGWSIREKTGSIGAVTPEYAEIAEKYLIRGDEGSFCPCPMGGHYGCTLTTEIKTGKYAGTRVVAAGLSLFSLMAKALGISLTAAWKLKELHNRLGLDYMRGPVAFAMELYQNKIITKQDTDGLELTQGNESAIMDLLHKIAHRNGFGAILAEGSVKASQIIGKGADRHVQAAKGLEPPTDPRLIRPEHQLSHLTNPRGGDDLKGTHGLADFPGLPRWAQNMGWSENRYLKWLLNRIDMFSEIKEEIFGVPPRLNHLNGPMLTKWYNDLTCVYNSLGFCMFSSTTIGLLGRTHFSTFYSACTGSTITPQEMMQCGDRIFNVMRIYNVREGMRREHDHWPSRFYEEPLTQEHGETPALSKKMIDQMLDRYYELRGWDKATGIPKPDKLEELDLQMNTGQIESAHHSNPESST